MATSINLNRVDEVVANVRHLLFITKTTGFVTGRSQKEWLQRLNADELALAGKLLSESRLNEHASR